MNVVAAAAMVAAWVALYAGHQVGDHIVQTQAQADGKAAPSPTELAAGARPWRGWSWCLGHLVGYVFAQEIALMVVATVVPIGRPGVGAALAFSAGTHAVIDRRWLVRWWLQRGGKDAWPDGPYLTDQAAHHGMLLVSAWLAAQVTTTTAAVGVAVLAGAVVAADLLAERVRAAEAIKTLR